MLGREENISGIKQYKKRNTFFQVGLKIKNFWIKYACVYLYHGYDYLFFSLSVYKYATRCVIYLPLKAQKAVFEATS